MGQQLEKNWAEWLQGFAQQLNPLYDEIFQRFPTAYYWTCYQSEWTTDMVFRGAAFLKRLMSILTPHGMMDFSSADVLRYFGRRIQPQGGPATSTDNSRGIGSGAGKANGCGNHPQRQGFSDV
jgi:hypothetical protein